MTSTHLSEELEKIGVTYSPSAVRNAWGRGAPKTNARDFAAWIAANSRIKTASAKAAAAATGLTIASPAHGAAVFFELFKEAGGAEFWLTASPLPWMILSEAAKGPVPGETPLGDLIGNQWLDAAVNAVVALTTLAEVAIEASAKLEAAGITGDATPWRAMYRSGDGPARLRIMACEEYEKFAALPDK
jgi:hypothetical protein